MLADCYRALRRYDKVDELWSELRASSPSAAVVAEGRIVAAGALADQGDLQGAIALLERSGPKPRRIREHHLRVWYALADLYDRSGDAPRARALHEEMLTIARSLPDENLRAEASYDLAVDALSVGDPQSAQAHLAVAVRRYRDMKHLDGLTRCLGALSALALNRGQAHLAARLIGAAAAARDSLGLTPWPAVTEGERRIIKRTGALLPAGEFAAQAAAGRLLTVEDALSQAMPVRHWARAAS